MLLETCNQPQPPIITLSPLPLSDHLSSSDDEASARVVAIGFTRNDGDGSDSSNCQDDGNSTDGSFAVRAGAEAWLNEVGVDPVALLARARARGTGGEAVSLEIFNHPEVELLLLVGLGRGSSRDMRRAGATVARTAQPRGKAAVALGSITEPDQLGAFVEGLVLGPFGFDRTSSASDGASERKAVEIQLTGLDPETLGRTVDDATTRGLASWQARYCSITPSNEKSPQQLESWARELVEPAGLQLEVWDDARLAAEGFGGIIAVGAASSYDSRFLRLDHVPGGSRGKKDVPRRFRRRNTGGPDPHVVLVGKGITFDTGGISIKPSAAMMNMKRDMTGAAVIMAVMGALQDLEVNVRVTGLVAAAENAFGAAAMRPGDVVTHYGGRTSAVDNTDAEGRLVLADALAYTQRHIDATVVIDVATLTGAGKVALGTSMGALFSNDDSLAGALESSGLLAGEPVWRLPLAEEYEDLLETQFADATNAAGGPGAVTAALFLQHFAGSKPWAHLDIASVGDSPQDAYEYSLGATGFGVRLLLRWLQTF